MAQQENDENRPPRLMTTDRLALVTPAMAARSLILQNVNAVLEENNTPIKLVDDLSDDADYKGVRRSSTSDSVDVQIDDENTAPFQIQSFATEQRDGRSEALEEAEIFQTIDALDKAITGGVLEGQVLAASPNWLMAAGPAEPGAFGGPGARPVPVLVQDPPHDLCFYPRTDTLRNIMPDHDTASGVTVVVLDTSPDQTTLKADAWLNDLLGSLEQKLNIITDPFIEADLAQLSMRRSQHHAGKYRLNIESHGLFVAGLIHSYVPKVDLHLVRVLNRYGAGTVDTVRRGIEIAMGLKQEGVPLVINMSLTMVFPFAGSLNDGLPAWLRNWDDLWNALDEEQASIISGLEEQGTMPRSPRPQLSKPGTLPQRLRYAMELTTRNAHRNGALLVAAAGNERKPGDEFLPLTQYPAAFDNVTGVGALLSIGTTKPEDVTSVKMAPYSCTVDKPAEEGFAVWGGNTEAPDAAETNLDRPLVTDHEYGVVGVWVGEDAPDPEGGDPVANEYGWVRWAGTSFATPIITALLALLMAMGRNREAAVTEVNDGWPGEESVPPSRSETPQVVIARQE